MQTVYGVQFDAISPMKWIIGRLQSTKTHRDVMDAVIIWRLQVKTSLDFAEAVVHWNLKYLTQHKFTKLCAV